jgi:hypothetical protein
LTTAIAGPDAVVSVVGWVKRPAGSSRNNSYGFLAGVWGDRDGGKPDAQGTSPGR